MENNSQQVQIGMPNELNEVGKYSIYTVPQFVREGKEECYHPLVISIGPVFYKDPRLNAMQRLKQYYLKCFREHPDNACQSLEPYNNFVRENESKIRECYEEQISLQGDEFIQMIVVDAIFLIQLFLFFSDIDDPPSNNTQALPLRWASKLAALSHVWPSDLFVQENQLPFFILKGIYDIAFGAVVKPCHCFLDLTLGFIDKTFYKILRPIKSIINGKKITDASSIQHMVHLLWMCYCLPVIGRKARKGQQAYVKIGTAKQLSAVGVTFTSIQSEGLFDITFDKSTGELKIPKLNLDDETEPLIRNILIFEQFHCHPNSYYFYDFIIFLDQLIDGVEDIRVLQQSEILINDIASDQHIADLFNNFEKDLPCGGSTCMYSDVCQDLKDYASTPWNRWKAIFWSRYFNHPWAIISFIYATILLILTIIQTIAGFKSN